MTDTGLDFDLGEMADTIRETTQRFARRQDRADRRRDRREGRIPARSCGRRWASSGCTASPSRRSTAALASAISSMSWRRRKWRAPRPRSASATAPTPTSASTRSAAGRTTSRSSKYLPKLISGEHVGALAMSEAGRRQRRRRDEAEGREESATAIASTAPSSGSPTAPTPTRWWSTPRPAKAAAGSPPS